MENLHRACGSTPNILLRRSSAGIVLTVPQQPNTTDCGLYLLAFTEFACQFFSRLPSKEPDLKAFVDFLWLGCQHDNVCLMRGYIRWALAVCVEACH